jgi:hypothetical protein
VYSLNNVGFPCGASYLRVTIATGDSVTLEYTGRLDDETVFDTSRKPVAEKTGLAEAQPEREYTPLTFSSRLLQHLRPQITRMKQIPRQFSFVHSRKSSEFETCSNNLALPISFVTESLPLISLSDTLSHLLKITLL